MTRREAWIFPCFRAVLYLLLLCPLTGQAVLVKHLYQANVSVSDQSTATREEAFIEGLKQVLIKVSGHLHVDELPELQMQLGQARHMLVRYAYLGTDLSDHTQTLQINFSPQKVNQFLSSAKQSIWEQERPLIMPLIAIVDQHGKSLLQQHDDLKRLMAQWAQTFAIPITWPILTSKTAAKRIAKAIWQQQLNWSRTWVSPYHAHYLLLGRIDTRHDTQVCHSDWLLVPTIPQTQDRIVRWQIPCADPTADVANMVQATAGLLAKQDGVIFSAEKQTCLLTIQAITSLEDYEAINTYLKSLNSIEQVHLESLTDTEATFRLSVLGHVTTLQHILNHATYFTPRAPRAPIPTSFVHHEKITSRDAPSHAQTIHLVYAYQTH